MQSPAAPAPAGPVEPDASASLPPRVRKRLVLEPDDDFMDAALLAEAEAETDGLDAEPPATATATADADADADADARVMQPVGGHEDVEMVFVRREGVREGKQRLVLVPDDADEPARRAPGPPRVVPDLSRVNFSSRTREMTPIAATTFNGRKITFRRRTRVDGGAVEAAKEQREAAEALTKLSKSMLDVPYHEMVKQIKEGEQQAKKGEQADTTNGVLEEFFAPLETSLWTDRYRPKKFTDLLGDERVHRSALLWLKEWDQCVFPKTSKTTAAAELKRERRKKRARDGKHFGTAPVPDDEVIVAPDPWGRPKQKILLLSGPPGLGKTTLAYVLAAQAGYKVLEVNGSDDRGARAVEELIKPALESKALSMDGGMAKNKPTCIVIDEIDGATGGSEAGFIGALIQLIVNGSSTKKRTAEDTGKKASTGKKGKKAVVHRPLLRPIICICNDLYAKSLRSLRPYACIVKFSPPTNAMLVSRLRTICAEEGLKADTKSLTMLTEIAEGDLRSCLNTLQFIKRRSPTVDASAIRSTSIGKDMETSARAVVTNLFKKTPRVKGASSNVDDKYVDRLVRDITTCGEQDWIVTSVFENYLLAKQVNDTWPRVLEALEWIWFHDNCKEHIKEDQEWGLSLYLPYALVPIYHLFATHTAKKLDTARADHEAYKMGQAHREILESFTFALPHHIKFHFTSFTIATELLPQLNRIIAPDLKPVNSQLIKSEERRVMKKLVSIMIATGLYFVQTKNDEGQPTYKLDPPIDVFVHYEGKRADDIGASRYAVRHMIANEMEAEDLRRTDGGANATTAEEILAAYQPKTTIAVVPDEKQAVDFFKRPLALKAKTEEEELMPPPPKRAKQAAYRFHEGFSNAVRLTKRVADFL